MLNRMLNRPLSWLAREHPLLWRARPHWLPLLWALGLLAIPVALLEPLAWQDLPTADLMTPMGVLVVLLTAPLYIAFVVLPRRRQPLGHVSGRELLVSFVWTYLGMGLVILPLCLYDGIVGHRISALLTPGQLSSLLASTRWWSGLERVQVEQARSAGALHPVLILAARSWLWRQQGCLAFALLGLLLDLLSSPRRSAWLMASRDWFRRQLQESLGPSGAPGASEWARLKLNWPGVWAAQLPLYLFPALALLVPAQQAMERFEAGWNSWLLLLLTLLLAWSLLHFGAGARRHSLQLGAAREWLRFALAAGLGWVAAVTLVLVLPPLLFAWFGQPQQQHREFLAAASRAPWLHAVLGLLLGTQVVSTGALAHCRVGRKLYGATVVMVGISALMWLFLTPQWGGLHHEEVLELTSAVAVAAALAVAVAWGALSLMGRRGGKTQASPGLGRTLLAWGCIVAMPFVALCVLALVSWIWPDITEQLEPSALTPILMLMLASWAMGFTVVARPAWRVLRQRGAIPPER